jgi:hypothetical protein
MYKEHFYIDHLFGRQLKPEIRGHYTDLLVVISISILRAQGPSNYAPYQSNKTYTGINPKKDVTIVVIHKPTAVTKGSICRRRAKFQANAICTKSIHDISPYSRNAVRIIKLREDGKSQLDPNHLSIVR